MQPSHTTAQYCQPCKLRMSANKRSATMRGVDTGSGQLRLPWIVTVSVLHGVRDVLFPRSCFLSFIEWLDDTLKITVGHRCPCADDTGTTTTTEIVYIQIDTFEMSAWYEKFKLDEEVCHERDASQSLVDGETSTEVTTDVWKYEADWSRAKANRKGLTGTSQEHHRLHLLRGKESREDVKDL